MSSTRTRRIERIAAVMPIVNQLRAHESDCDRNWMTRHDSREDRALWLVTPISHGTREEDARADSNYEVAERLLNEASGFAEAGRWPDWTALDGTVYRGATYWTGGTSTRDDAWPGGVIETLLVRADDALALRELERIIDTLSDSAELDDEHAAALEWERAHPDENNCYSEQEDCPCAAMNHDHTGPDFDPADADEDGEIYCRACGQWVQPGSRAGNGNTHGEDEN
jgi:hypothetical protein